MRNIGLLAVCALLGTVSTARAEVRLSLANGHVTIIAKDATVRQILTEWARVGQTKVVNVDRIPGTPLTIELHDVPEQQALKTLLRSISGYVTAPRVTMAAADTSVFDRIIVMPTLAPAAAPLGAAPPPTSAPMFTQTPAALPEDNADEQRANAVGGQPAPGNRGPVFVFPQPQVTSAPSAGGQAGQPQFFPPTPGAANAPPPPFLTQPAAPAPTVSYPGASTTSSPAGVAVPGMVVPAPAPVTQPGQPQPQQ